MATQLASPFAVKRSELFWKAVSLAQDWQLHSGICESGGGVARFYRLDHRAFAAISNEITGYYVSSMLHAYETLGDRKYLDRAIESAKYLVDQAWDAGAGTFPFEPPGLDGAGFTYFFDCGIILRALVAMWQVTGDASYLERAEGTAEAMWRDFVGMGAVPAGAGLRLTRIYPILSVRDKRALPQTGRWSQSSGCYQLKAALGWDDLGRVTGRKYWRDRYLHAADYCLRVHPQFIDPELQDSSVMDRLHAYCYFLEGLFPAITDHAEYSAEALVALRSGIQLVGQTMRYVSPVLLRSDVCAQLLRARLLADVLGLQPLDHEHAVEEVALIENFQAQHSDRRIHGGFYFGREGNVQRPFVNPVSTAFCVQALSMWDQYCDGELSPETSKLI